MTFFRRLLLVFMVFAVPLVVAQGMHEITIMVLEHTDTVINPVLLRYIAIAEYMAIFTFCLLEAEERW